MVLYVELSTALLPSSLFCRESQMVNIEARAHYYAVVPCKCTALNSVEVGARVSKYLTTAKVKHTQPLVATLHGYFA